MIDYRKTEDGIMELHVSGKITKDEIDAVWTRMEADMPEHGKVRLLEVISDLEGIEPAALWRDLRLGLPMIDRVERAAAVTDIGWIEAFSNVGDVFASAEIRTFEPNEIEEARAWLKAA